MTHVLLWLGMFMLLLVFYEKNGKRKRKVLPYFSSDCSPFQNLSTSAFKLRRDASPAANQCSLGIFYGTH